MVIGLRQRIIEATVGDPSDDIALSDDDGDEERRVKVRQGPSKEALEKFTDYSRFSGHALSNAAQGCLLSDSVSHRRAGGRGYKRSPNEAPLPTPEIFGA